MDSILVISNQDEKLDKFLTKIGYSVQRPKQEQPLKEIVETSLLDLVIIDCNYDLNLSDVWEFVRSAENTKEVPVLCLVKDQMQALEIKELSANKVECLPEPYSIGTIVARVATELRLRKNKGKESATATLAEANASLRDLNERFRRELEQARSIQQSLLPHRLPASKYFEIAVVYKPLEEVGGDWYFIEEKAGKLSVQVADVTGHGLAAAFIGCMTKLALTAAKKDKPNELLKEMNRLMSPQLPQGTFVTTCCYSYDSKSGVVEFGRAGHPPGILISRAKNTATKINSDGFPLGFLEDSEYALDTAQMEPDDLLITYTDGISEAQNRAGAQYGMDKMGEIALAAPKESSCQQIIKKILADFDTFCDGRILKDDITLVVLKRR